MSKLYKNDHLWLKIYYVITISAKLFDTNTNRKHVTTETFQIR